MPQEEESNYTETRVASVVLSHDLNSWKAFVAFVLKETVPSGASVALIECALRHLNEVAAHANLPFAINAGRILLAEVAHLGAMWGPVLFNIRGAVANWCVREGDEEGARELWHAMLPADNGVTSLRLLTNILNSALRTRSYTAAETKCLRGLGLCKALSMQPEANEVVNAFLESLASLMVARYRLLEASQRFYDLYIRTRNLSHLRMATVCAIQTDASASRSQMLGTLYRDENAGHLGDLYDILYRAFNSYILRPSDLQRFVTYVEPPFDRVSVDSAFIQHNLQAISRVYYNIGFAELGALLGIAASEAEQIVARMVSEKRLDASLDQTTETVVFSQLDNMSVLEAWNSRIGSVCEELSYVADIIFSHNSDLEEGLLPRQK